MENDFEKIELRCYEVQDILSRPPHFLIRYGIGLVSVLISLLVALVLCFPIV